MPEHNAQNAQNTQNAYNAQTHDTQNKHHNMFDNGPIIIDIEGPTLLEREHALIQHPAVGGVLLFTRNYRDKETLKKLVQDLKHVAAKPLLIAVDHEGGRVWRFKEGFSKLPPAKFFGEKYDENPTEGLKLAREAGQTMAAELLECGVDLSLAPVLDLDKGISQVILDRAFHREPAIIVKLATAFIEGMNAAGMPATGKHFPGHGGCAPDSHVAKPIDDRSLSQLLKEDIIPFQALIANQLLAFIMPAHIVFPAVDSLPVGFSKIWLQDILRQQLGFKGIIISDCLSMKGAAIEKETDKDNGDANDNNLALRTKMAIEAGCNKVIIAQQSREALADILNSLLNKNLIQIS